jgi:signal peptidase I
VESVIVAFILAFLFRAFVAEAFVIPTGSMAPTLMGAHKDLFCDYCGQQYQASASQEFDSNSGALRDTVTVASTCATCRGLNAYDLRDNPNHASFTGDRILVSKFDYILSKPERWDVFVFKYPDEARMNYIKRLVGLPGESMLIEGGDVYVKEAGAEEWTIARKPPTKIRAMRQIVSDTKFQAAILVEQGWPSLWQPLTQSDNKWKVDHQPTSWTAQLSASEAPHWLRYYHKTLGDADWYDVLAGEKLAAIDPYQSELVTDYLAYNSSIPWIRRRLYDGKKLIEEIDADTSALEVAVSQGLDLQNSSVPNDGRHWVGDLVSEFEVEVKSDGGKLLLDLVEYGIHFECSIDVSTGIATIASTGDELQQSPFPSAAAPRGQTTIRGSGSYRVELANVDDQIVLWVDGKPIEFDKPTTYDSREFRGAQTRRPYWTSSDPLDAAPVGIGGQEIELSVSRAKVYRDIYYIAVQSVAFASEYSDYDLGSLGSLRAAIPDVSSRDRIRSAAEAIDAVYSHPEWWSKTNLFGLRGKMTFDLEEGQYFPMGDNSAFSSDARAWYGHNYVERKFLLGKALMVFWPHTWNSPIPFMPNFARMGLIR